MPATAPSDLTSKRAYDLVSEATARSANGPLLVAVDLAGADPRRRSRPSPPTWRTPPGVATVVPPVVNEAGDAAVISVIPTTGPQAQATEDLVHTLRDDVLPPRSKPPAPTASVGGTTAAFIDDSEQTRLAGCRCSSVASWCCRSCC